MTDSPEINKIKLTQDILSNPTYPLPKPEISLRRIERINTYEVIESDLEDLDKSMQSENQTLGFTSLSLGALISTGLSWAGASTLSPTAYAVYFSMFAILSISSLFFGITWFREKNSRKGLLSRIRSQTVVTQEEHWKQGA